MKPILELYLKIKRVILFLKKILLDLEIIEKNAFIIKDNLKLQKIKD